MQGLFRAAIAAFAALLGFGFFAMTASAPASADDVVAKREDSASVLLSEDDDDDDDDETDMTDTTDTVGTSAGTSFDSNTGVSNDATGSRVTAVSRDRDISNDDLTRDWTRDGGDPTRDFTQNHTNDASRNDTR